MKTTFQGPMLTLSLVLGIAGCQNNSDKIFPLDQAGTAAGDLANKTDAADPNAPGLVRYSYVCGDMPEKSVELPHVRFGATYKCDFESNFFTITVTDDRVPVSFHLGVPGYHGPGTYTLIADDYIIAGTRQCRWPSIEVADKNCKPLWLGIFTTCCSTMEARAKALTCTVVVQQHTLTRASGTFDCRIQTEEDGPGAPDYCPPSIAAQVHGSFDFGPQDCL